MKTLTLTGALILLGAVGGAQADLTVVQKIEFGGEGHVVSTLKFRAGKTRVDAVRGTTLIMDLKSGMMLSFNQATKTYFKEVLSPVTPPTADGSKPVLTATGRKETISGFPADEYTGTVAGLKTALWLTKALPDYEKIVAEMRSSSQGPLGTRTLTDGINIDELPGFPIRIVSESTPGQTGATLTVVSVSTGPVDDSQFEVPAGYQELGKPVLTPPAAMESSPLPSPSR